MKTVLILGLGRFGFALANALSRESSVEIIAADREEELVNRAKEVVAQAVVGDVRDRSVLSHLCADGVDLAVVTIGDRVESSVIATLLLKELGVEQVFARAKNDDHGEILRKIGADRVVQPLPDSAARLAKSIASPHLLDFVLVGKDFAVAESPVTETMVGQSLAQLELRRRFGVTVVAIKSGTADGKENVRTPDPEAKLQEGDHMLIVGTNEDLERFQTA